jgi:hypothetical protein
MTRKFGMMRIGLDVRIALGGGVLGERIFLKRSADATLGAGFWFKFVEIYLNRSQPYLA